MRVKICGITRPEDAIFAEKEGADAIGVVVCSDGSKRSVPLSRAREIFGAVGPFTTTVAVTHTQSESDLRQILALSPDAVQIFHPFLLAPDAGVRVIRAIGSDDPLPADCDAVIIDESHGGGKAFDLALARNAVQQSKVKVILAGGLNAENVGAAIRQVRPYAVDVATGVEISPGIKDPVKVRAFIAACRGY
jgi:phosphoribosylanthranilate isomerase